MTNMPIIRVLAWAEAPRSLSDRLILACDQPCVVQVDNRSVVPLCPQVEAVLRRLDQRRLGERSLHPDTIVVSV